MTLPALRRLSSASPSIRPNSSVTSGVRPASGIVWIEKRGFINTYKGPSYLPYNLHEAC